MAFGPRTSWQIDVETMETVTDFIFLGSEITVDGECSHDIKGCWILGRKVMTNLNSIFKKKAKTLLCQQRSYSQSYGFSSSHKWMWESEEVKVKSYSRVWLFAIPRTIGHQASLSMGLFRQEYWNGLPFPSPGGIPYPAIEPRSPTLQTDVLQSEPPGKPSIMDVRPEP